MHKIHLLAYPLVIVGAINWGLIGAANFNLISMLFGMWPMIERGIYIAVGLAAVYEVLVHPGYCMMCGPMMGDGNGMMMHSGMSKKTSKSRRK